MRPSKSTQNSLPNSSIETLVANFTDALVETVDSAVRSKISVLLQNNFASAGDAGDDSAVDLGDLSRTLARKVVARRKARLKAKGPKQIRPCKVPKCKKPSKGPRFHFLCEDHREFGKKKLAEAMNGTAAKPRATKKAKTETKTDSVQEAA